MRALVMRGERDMRLEELDFPEPGPNDVRVQMVTSGVCHTNLTVLNGGGRGPTKVGVVPLFDGARGRSLRSAKSNTGQGRRPDCGDIPSALVWWTYQAEIPHRPAWRQSRLDAGGRGKCQSQQIDRQQGLRG